MAIIQTTNQKEDQVEAKPVQNDPGVTGAFQTSLADELNNSIDSEYKRLPSQQNQGNINWLGSSYTGSDIKVVAHLYGDPNDISAKERLIKDQQIAQKIADACTVLNADGLAYLAARVDDGDRPSIKKELFLSAAGLSVQGDEIEQAAGNYLINSLLYTSTWSTFIGLARVKRAVAGIQQSQEMLSKSLSNQIENIEKMIQSGKENGVSEVGTTIVLASLQTISIQSHREKFAVRALGHSYVKGYTRGPRTIGGSMIFTTFDEHSLSALIRGLANSKTYGEMDPNLATLLPDQLPPIDLTIVFANEYGSVSSMRMLGVEFVNDGMTMSIEDLLTETVANFVCRDADILTKHGNMLLSRIQGQGLTDGYAIEDLNGTQLFFNNARYDNYVEKLGIRHNLKGR